MTTGQLPLARSGITIDPWDPGYGSSATAEAFAELDASSAELELDLEMPAGQWRPVTPNPATPIPETVLISDGVRRIDARIWVDHPEHPMPAPGIAASCAAGLVRCGLTNDTMAALAEVDVSRALFTPVSAIDDLATRAGRYFALPAADATAEKLSLALQAHLAELEVTLAKKYREAAGDEELLIVDGPLHGRTHLVRTIGYVKTHHSAYLSGGPAAVLAGLETGQRTPVFLMGTSWKRASWYLRLPTRSSAPWAGIARCEVGAELPLEEVIELADTATLTLPRLAGVDYKDPRAPQNLVPIGGLEKLLRHRLGDPAFLYRALRVAANSPLAS